MLDPHVVSIRYKVCTGQTVTYDSPPPISFSEPGFDGVLNGGILTITFKVHHATAGSAQANVNSFIRAWEIATAIESGPGVLSFEFIDANVVERSPPPNGSHVLHGLAGSARITFSANATLSVVRHQYPSPPLNFAATPLVELLWARYQNYQNGKDLLTTMGYACLSAVQSQAGGRKKASNQYNVHIDVLDNLGKLTSDVGDELSARKFDGSSSRRPHSQSETNWIEFTVKTLIRRVAEYENDPTALMPQITLADLPAC